MAPWTKMVCYKKRILKKFKNSEGSTEMVPNSYRKSKDKKENSTILNC